MKNTFATLLLVFIYGSLLADGDTNTIIKIRFLSQPYSTRMPKSSGTSSEAQSTLALEKGYQYYYTLYINPRTKQSIYKFDTLILNKPKEKANVDLTVNNKLGYVLRFNSTDYNLYEEIFQRKFYASGAATDIEWNITSEKKKINGYDCIKATSKNANLLTTVWFSQQIPISSGPSNFFGLPGMVVWSEDFFWTTNLIELKNIRDNSNGFSFARAFAQLSSEFDSKKGKDAIKESVLLVKKTELVKSMITMAGGSN